MARATILLRGNAREERGIATGSVITPGNVVVPSGSGAGWARAGAGAAPAPIAFAREQHERDGNTWNDNILQNDEFTVIFPEQGAKIYAVATTTIDRGEELTTAANGAVAVRAAGEPLIGVAASASDLTVNRVEMWVGGSIGTESV